MKGFDLIIGAILLLLSSCGNDAVCRIEGKIDNLENQTIYAVFESEGVNMMDTVLCGKPGRFRLEQEQGNFQQVTLFFEDRTAWFTVYLEPKIKKIEIKGDIRYPDLLQAKGGQLNNELSSFRKKMEALLKEGTDIRKSMNAGSPGERNELVSRLANVKHQLDEYALAYIQANPDKPASVVLTKTYFTNPEDTRRLDELLIILAPELKDFYLVSDLEQYSIRAKRTALGAEAPGFTVKNIYGKTVSLDSFPQKYVLLTFTAPWCDMCRPDDLYLDEIDKKYSKEQLEQLLVSLDDDMKGVRDILKMDSIHWNLVADSAGQATMLVDLYNVSSLPRSFLIDEDGKIILKTENGVEIKQALERLIK